MNEPGTIPLEVLLFAIVGFGDVLQQMPLARIPPPPSFVIVPPDVAVVEVMAVTAVVVIVGSTTVNALTSLEYTVELPEILYE